MKKRTSEKSFLKKNEYLTRYFVLDIQQALFKFAAAPNLKGKIVHFRDIKHLRIDHADKDPFADKDFPYAYVLECSTRNFYLGTATRVEREMWVNGFKVLFDFREKT